MLNKVAEANMASPLDVSDKRTTRRIFYAALIITLATVFTPPDLRMMEFPLWKVLGLSEAEWAVFVTARGLLYIVFILGIGLLGDFFGRRRVLLLTLEGFILCVLVMAVIPVDYWYLIFYSLSTTLGLMIRIIAITMVILAFKPRERLVPTMIYSMIVGLVIIFSPIIAREIWRAANFRTIFIFPLILSILGFVMAFKYIPESGASSDLKRINVIALAIYTFSLCLLIFSFMLAGGLGWTHRLVLSSLAAGSVLIILLKWLERVKLPENLRFRLMYNDKLSVAIFAGVIINVALIAITLQIFNFFKEVQDYPVLIAALALLPILIGGIGLTVITARFTVKWGIAQAMSLSLVVLAIPSAILFFLEPNISYFVILPCLILVGFGFILGNSPRLILLASSVPQNISATVQAIGSSTAQLGSGLAYSFMIMITHGFGNRVLFKIIQEMGLSKEQVTGIFLTLADANDVFSSITLTDTQSWMLEQIPQWVEDAYVYGLSRAMLILSGVCLVSAAVVYLGLRKSEEPK